MTPSTARDTHHKLGAHIAQEFRFFFEKSGRLAGLTADPNEPTGPPFKHANSPRQGKFF
jgi:hypothetical protein